MLKINFSQNPHGKLFLDFFGDVRLADREKFCVGNCLEVSHKDQSLGIVQVVGIKEFSYSRLSDTLTFINIGKGAPYQAALLQRFYPTVNFEADTLLQYIVFHYTKRNIEVQEPLIRDWWQAKVDQQTF